MPFRPSDKLKNVLNIALPSIAEMLFVSLAGLIDSYMVSSLGANAVASVGLTGQPKMIGLAVFTSMNVAVSALVARRFGEKKRREAGGILMTSLLATLILVTFVSTACVFYAPQILHLCGSTPDTHDGAVTYFRIIMGGMLFNCVQLVINSALRGIGDTKITMRTNITSNTVNIIFNYLLIGGNFGFPALGIAGAALATVLGTVVSSVMSLVSLFRKDRFLNLPYCISEGVRPSLDAMRSIIRIGYGVFGEQLLLRIGFLATALMAADQGDAAMAAHQVTMNVMSLSFSCGDGLQQTAIALIGRSLGEKDPDLAKEYGTLCQRLGLAFSLTLAVLYFFGGHTIMAMFFREPEIVELGAGLLRIVILIVLFQIRQIVYMGSLRGAGDTLYTAVAGAVSVTVIRTAASYILCYPLGLGIHGIWFGILADQVSRFIFASLRFRSGKWTKIRI